ncbi:MAG: iron ABC transporter permease [Candidatus Methanomethylophilus sp.]|jgi:ABC-type Fe3+-siderophore transport system permease subunit|nr:iron ABC transporter permease [Methanomethylophilus sp.]MCI2093760.1 iron ABC transporter permease [Methanomethylophilus sp.]
MPENIFSDRESFLSAYKRYTFRKVLLILLFILVSVIAFGLELSVGAYGVGFVESYEALIDHILGNVPADELGKGVDMIVWDKRLPRAIAGFAVGSALGVCGAAMQSSLKNPLADPYTTGISSGASLGASLAIISGFSVMSGAYGETAIIVNAFLFALIPAAVILLASMFKRDISPSTMILIGIAVMYFFTATTTLLKLTASEESLAEIYMWNIGTLGKSSWNNVWIQTAAAIIGIAAIMIVSKKLNVLAMCNKDAVTLGINPKKFRMISLLIVSLVTAVIVSFTGTIGFVGLIAPHISRLLLGSDNKYLVPASATFGAALLLCSDCVAKSIGTGLPVGVITAIIGGPLLIYMLMGQAKRYSW